MKLGRSRGRLDPVVNKGAVVSKYEDQKSMNAETVIHVNNRGRGNNG